VAIGSFDQTTRTVFFVRFKDRLNDNDIVITAVLGVKSSSCQDGQSLVTGPLITVC